MRSTALLTRRIFTCCICAEIQSISGGLRYPYLPPCAILTKTLKLEFSEIFGKKSALFAANPAKATSFGHLSGGLLSVCGHLGPRRIPWKVSPLRHVPGPRSLVAVRAPWPSTRPSPHFQPGIARPSPWPARSDRGPTPRPVRLPCGHWGGFGRSDWSGRSGGSGSGRSGPTASAAPAAPATRASPAGPTAPAVPAAPEAREAPAPGSSARPRRFRRLRRRALAAPVAPGALTGHAGPTGPAS